MCPPRQETKNESVEIFDKFVGFQCVCYAKLRNQIVKPHMLMWLLSQNAVSALEHLGDDVHNLLQFVFLYDKWRGETDDVIVSRLRQHSFLGQHHTDVPRGHVVTFVDHDGIQ